MGKSLAQLIIASYAPLPLLLYLNIHGIDKLMYFIPVDKDFQVYQQRISIYILISFLVFGVSWFFYIASLYSVSQYGNLIRSAYDLFHLDLLKILRLDDLPPDELPQNTEEEREIWKRVFEFITIGEVNGPLIFDYEKPKLQKNTDRHSKP